MKENGSLLRGLGAPLAGREGSVGCMNQERSELYDFKRQTQISSKKKKKERALLDAVDTVFTDRTKIKQRGKRGEKGCGSGGGRNPLIVREGKEKKARNAKDAMRSLNPPKGVRKKGKDIKNKEPLPPGKTKKKRRVHRGEKLGASVVSQKRGDLKILRWRTMKKGRDVHQGRKMY